MTRHSRRLQNMDPDEHLDGPAPPSFQLYGCGQLSCSYVRGRDWCPFSYPGGSTDFAPAVLSRSGRLYL